MRFWRAHFPWALPALLLAACAPSAPDPAGGPGSAASGIRDQFIYVIHGDAGYTYYDAEGAKHKADDDALAQAMEVARHSPGAEVFIFHQKPVRFLGIFPGADGSLRQYRNGMEIRREGYRRPPDASGLRAEAALFGKYASRTPSDPAGSRVFLYFGHEIPVTGGVPYSRSRQDTGFALAAFAAGLRGFAGAGNEREKPFRLIVLSTCHGGTPAASLALAPYADYLLASPGELHLSYFDARALADLSRESAPQDAPGQGRAWGRALAAASYARLIGNTATSVTVSLYDTEKASAYLMEHLRHMERMDHTGIPALPKAGEAAYGAYADCAADPAFGPGGGPAGATVYYRAPRFGPDQRREFRSGWECPAAGIQKPMATMRVLGLAHSE